MGRITRTYETATYKVGDEIRDAIFDTKALVGFPESDSELTEEEIERELNRADVVNQVLGVQRPTEIVQLSATGARELQQDIGNAYRCDLCGHVFGAERMVRLSGKYYCTVNECAEEFIVGGQS